MDYGDGLAGVAGGGVAAWAGAWRGELGFDFGTENRADLRVDDQKTCCGNANGADEWAAGEVVIDEGGESSKRPDRQP